MADTKKPENNILGTILRGTQVLAPLGGSIGGLVLSKDELKKQQQSMEETAKLFEQAGLPPDLSRQLALQQYQAGPMMSPYLEDDLQIGPSSVAGMEISPEGRQTQMEALEAYKQMASLGLSPTDRASLNKVRDEVAAQSEGRRQQILQQMQSRGLSGSGQELASLIASGQQGSQQASQEADRLASLTFEGRRAALSSMGSLGREMRAGDFEEEKTRRTAQDLFQKYATDNSIQRQQRNVAQQNLAQLQNVGRQHSILDKNTEEYNKELQRQNEAKNNAYKLMLDRAKLGSDTYKGVGEYYGKQAGNIQKASSDIGTQVGGLAKDIYENELFGNTKEETTPKESTTPIVKSDGGIDWFALSKKISNMV